jgi:hypothetical protein
MTLFEVIESKHWLHSDGRTDRQPRFRTLYKSIAFAYPTSPIATRLDCYSDGGWYVENRGTREDGSIWTDVAQGTGEEAFATCDDADLLALYRETEGAPDPMFLRYGPEKALAALGLERAP